MTLKSINDEIINDKSKDMLNISQYIKGLTAFVRNCETPMTLAIQGKWGTGKSSIMKLLQNELDNNNVETLYFNTWQYSQLHENLYENFVMYLINHLIANSDNKHNINTLILSELIKPFIDNAIELIPLENVKDIIKKETSILNNEFFQKKLTQIEGIENYKDNFSKLIIEILNKNKKSRYVFFIDDLDRLPPDQALELLEIVKLFLDVPKCVFILAIDYDVVIEGVRRKYGNDFSKGKGKDFFDKIIQVPFNVPTFSYNIEPLLKNGINNTIDKHLNYAVKITTICTENNPRTIKRIINSYNLMNAILNNNKDQDYCICLYVIQCIQNTCQELFYFLYENLDILENTLHEKENTELDNYLQQYSMSQILVHRINDCYELVKDLINNDTELLQKFKEVLSHSTKNNDISNLSAAKVEITTNNSENNSPKVFNVNSTVEAFTKSVEFILNHQKENSSINNFKNWITTEKNNGKNGYFRKERLLCDQKYVLGIYSSSLVQMRQTNDLWKNCAQDNICIKWYDSNNELLFTLPPKDK